MVTFGNSCKTIMAGVLTLALTACGGGDGGPGTGDVINGGGGGGGGATAVSGTFVDSPVNGLDYQANPSGVTGVTGDNGTDGGFTVEAGDTVTFSLGGIVLGTSRPVEDDGIITPAELAGNRLDSSNPRAIRIARLLQSLDDDGDTSNGIEITDATVAAIEALDATARDNMLAALVSGTSFDSLVGGLIDELTAGNTVPRVEGDLVTAVAAELELAAAVNAATGGGGSTTSSITAHPTGACPIGLLASAKSPEIFGQTFPVCAIKGRINNDVTLTNDHVYVLQEEINVGDGDAAGGPTGSNNAVLTIEPGTQIFGYAGAKASLVITRGSRIQAIGTPDMPIIMSGVNAEGTDASLVITDDPTDLTSDAGLWGGLVLSGRGINNKCTGGEVAAEAVEVVGSRLFGCNNNADSSGTVEYVVIAESGFLFRTDQEVQGLTIEGAGSGTRINYLQILGSEDDGIEWFGGAASASNIVINGADDDALDWDEGFVGTIQNALVIFGDGEGDKGIEADNAGPGDDATPVSRPNLLNLTMLGVEGKGSSIALHFKVGSGGAFWRSAIVDYAGKGAFANGCALMDNQIDIHLAFRDVIFDCANGAAEVPPGFGVSAGLAETFFTGGTPIVGSDEDKVAIAADRRVVHALTGTIDPATLAIVGQGNAPTVTVTATGVNGNPIGNYFGAVDPASGAPDGNPNNNGAGGGPFWDGWTYRNTAVPGNLPGVNFHPLEAEIAAGVQ